MRIADFVVLLLSLQAVDVAAQESSAHGSASLAGIATHITGARIPDAVAELHSEASSDRVFRTITDSLGVYYFPSLPAGEYDLQLSRPDFSLLTIRSIRIQDGEQRELPALQLAATFCGDDHAVLDFAQLRRLGDYTGNLTGRVTLDQRPLLEQSPPVASADVTLLCSTGKICGTATTDSDGEFAFWDLSPGTFSLRVDHRGYYSVTKPGYVVRKGLDSIYRPLYIERCPADKCEPSQRPKRLLGLCETR